MAESLQLTNDPISLLSTGLLAGNYTGTLVIDYSTGKVTGSILTSPVLGSALPILNFSQFTSTFNAGTDTYTLTSPGDGIAGSLTTFTLTYQGQTPTSVNSSVALVGAVPVFGATNNPVASTLVCFVEGTLIRTPKGDVAIENLRVGDSVLTSSGRERPITWLSHRAIDCRRLPNPCSAMPVRISADAFGVGLPETDLLVSPGHAICVTVVEEVLIPASSLINGSTIAQIDTDTVTYWHVELDSHDIILANGLPTESYIDVGNRVFFTIGNGSVDPLRDAATIADYCRPFVTRDPVVSAVRNRLRNRATELGWSVEDAPLDLRLEVDGDIIEPTLDGLTARFLLPATAKDVWLVSPTGVPSFYSDTPDDRVLGVYIKGLAVDDGLSTRRAIAIDDALFCVGFQAPEGEGAAARRWTAGRSRLSETFWEGCKGQFFLRIELVQGALPRWVPPVGHSMAPSSTDRTQRLSLLEAA